MVRAGCPWRMLPNDLPPWSTGPQQTQRWIRAGCFAAMAHDLRKLRRLPAGWQTPPSAVILDGRTLRSTPESGSRAGDAGDKRTKGSKGPAAVDTLGRLFALQVTAASEPERAQVAALVKDVPEATGEKGAVAFADSRRHRGRPRRPSGPARSSPGRSQTRRSQEGLCPSAKALGGRALLCLERPFPPPGQRL